MTGVRGGGGGWVVEEGEGQIQKKLKSSGVYYKGGIIRVEWRNSGTVHRDEQGSIVEIATMIIAFKDFLRTYVWWGMIGRTIGFCTKH